MPRSYRYLHYDVFTDHLFGGNQLAVVLDAHGLTDVVMQAIAKEMSFSETTFVLPANGDGSDIRMRIFTPGEELPMAGHPTVGTTFALARSGFIAPGTTRFVFGLKIGPTPVLLTWKNDELSFVWMMQPNPVFGEPIAEPARAAAALGLPRAAVETTGHPVQVVSSGAPYLFVPVATRTAVDSVTIDGPALGALLAETRSGAHGAFVFSTQPGNDGATAYSRMFAPGLGIAEDPATGSASGPLGCYLVRHRIVPLERAGAMMSLQGAKMGRPSHVHIAIEGDGDTVTSVRVGGEAVLAGEGILYV